MDSPAGGQDLTRNVKSLANAYLFAAIARGTPRTALRTAAYASSLRCAAETGPSARASVEMTASMAPVFASRTVAFTLQTTGAGASGSYVLAASGGIAAESPSDCNKIDAIYSF